MNDKITSFFSNVENYPTYCDDFSCKNLPESILNIIKKYLLTVARHNKSQEIP